MSLSRAVAALALVLAVALVAWLLLLRGSPGHEYTFVFENAGQLVRDNDVQVGGRRVGSITDIELTEDNQAAVTVKVEEPFAPLREGTEATIRLTSLSGIANRYVALAMGPGDAPELDDGAVLGTNTTTSVVDLDQLFNTLDEQTRGSLQDVIKGFAAQYEGKESEAAMAAEYFNPLLSTSRQLIGELTEDESALTRFIVESGSLSAALADRRSDLAALVGNANATTGAISAENVALAQALGLLPTTLRRANTTFVNLRSTLDDLDQLVEESKPATKDLARFLRELRPLIHDARPTVADLRELIRSPGSDNDLIELTAKQPRLAQLTASVFPRAIQTLDQAQPVFEYFRGYTPDFASWIADFGQVAANYDANGHYARVQPMFLPTNYSGGTLTAVDPSQKFNGFETNVKNRCPGGVIQAGADGSSPFPFGGCDTGATP